MAKIYKIALIFLFFGILPAAAEAATLYVSPSSGNFYKAENFEVRILVNSDVAINAVSGVLIFPTKYLKVLEIKKTNSLINIWPEEPSFSNAGEFGNIRLEGVILNPGFTGNGGTIADVVFRINSTGAADVNFIQSAILANDGLGTNVVVSTGGANFILLPPRTPTAQGQNQAEKSVPQPQVIILKQLQYGGSSGVLSFWESLPTWVKASVLISLGLATITFSLIVLSLGGIILVWLWGNIWHRKYQFLALLRRLAQAPKNFVFKALSFLGIAKQEIEGDIQYSFRQLIKEFNEASRAPSFKNLIKDWFFLLGNIVRRFFTRNSTEIPKKDERDWDDTKNITGKEIFHFKEDMRTKSGDSDKLK